MKIFTSKVSIFLLIFILNGFAQVPLLLNYQGKLADQDGQPLNRTANINFKIFDAETGGTEMWSETHSGITVSKGIFNVMLGSVATLSADVFSGMGTRYLEISVDSETLTPRFHLVSVAYALRAAEADSVGDNSVGTAQLKDGSITQIKLDDGITAIPSGSAGGDLSGNYPNPSVDGILGRAISATAPADGQVLKYNNSASQWEPANDISGGDGTVSTTARLSGNGSSASPLDIAQQGATTNQVLQWNGSAWGPGTVSVSSGNTLDQAYDQGGAGAGRVITADNGAVSIAGTGGLDVTGDISANRFSGSGSALTNLNATNLSSGTVPSARLDADLVDLIDGSLTGSKVGTGINADNITTGRLSSDRLDADLSDLADGSLTGSKVGTGISASNITTGTLSDSRLETNIDRSVITASTNMGIGVTNPSSSYAFHINADDRVRGIYLDYDQTTSNSPNYGLHVDMMNSYSGNSTNYGIYSGVTDNSSSSSSYHTYGLRGYVTGSSSSLKYGVYGRAFNNSNTSPIYGVFGDVSGTGSGSGYKYGVYGNATGDGIVYGVYGNVTSSNTYSQGVRGVNGSYAGVLGGSNRGIEGANGTTIWGYIGGSYAGYFTNTTASNYCYFGSSTYSGYFYGDVHVNGNLSKSSGTFKIDHPLDPENKYLRHSFVESPDMKNIYDGVIVLNSDGEATVQLPEWFGALNISYRYQLTAIGAPGPDLYISQEISGNQFSIAGGDPGMKVSWQVTGIRNDAYAQKHRIIVEEEKPAEKRGKYLNPEAFNLPETMSEVAQEKPLNIEQRVD